MGHRMRTMTVSSVRDVAAQNTTPHTRLHTISRLARMQLMLVLDLQYLLQVVEAGTDLIIGCEWAVAQRQTGAVQLVGTICSQTQDDM
jgi:hypothetical protein